MSRGKDKKSSELAVITKAKDLCSYVFLVTQKSPKKFRFTFTGRMQNLCLDIVENLYLANECFVGGSDAERNYQKRLNHQHKALTQIKLLAYFAQLAEEEKAILPKQFAHTAKLSTDCQYLVAGWIKSDKARFRK